MSTAPSPSPRPRKGLFTGIHRNVVALGVTSLLTDISSEMLVPILPLFITGTLGASVASLGVIEGVAECTASVLRIGAGWMSDRIGRRKPFLVFGYGLSAVAKASMAFAGSWPAVMFLRFGDRVGKGLRNPPRDALIADSTADPDMGRAFGLHRAMDTFGAAIGPLLGWWLLSHWSDLGVERYRRIFLVSAIPATLSIVCLVLFVHAPRRVKQVRSLASQARALSGPFRRFLLVDAVFQLGNSSMAFMLLRTQAAGWDAGQVSLVYLAYNLLYASLSIPLGTWSDRIGRRPLLFVGYLVYAATYALMAWQPTRWGVVGAFLALGVHSALIEGQAKSLIADLVPHDVRATAYGVYFAVVGAALLPASIAAGLLWEHVSPAAPFVLGAGLALVAAALLATLLPSAREREERHVTA